MSLVRDTMVVGAATFIVGSVLMEISVKDESGEPVGWWPYAGTFIAGALGFYLLAATNVVKVKNAESFGAEEVCSECDVEDSDSVRKCPDCMDSFCLDHMRMCEVDGCIDLYVPKCESCFENHPCLGREAESFSANPQGRPKCVKCNHRYGQGTCAACGNILCERCHGDGEWCKSCPPKCDWCNTPAHSCPDSPSCDNSLCDECCKDYAAESFEAFTPCEDCEGRNMITAEGVKFYRRIPCNQCGSMLCPVCYHEDYGHYSLSPECYHSKSLDDWYPSPCSKCGNTNCGGCSKRADSFSATKGIDTFTEPFDELSLDSGNIKKVIVGIGIGVAAILAYNKWK